MVELRISEGASRKSEKWVNKKITWDDFVERCRDPRRTAFTVAEYFALNPDQRAALKDAGGYVLGACRGGKRSRATVESRDGLTLDIDHADPEFLQRLAALIKYKCLIYSTHSHTTDKPRYRLVIPLSRTVTPDEYVAVSRLVAADIGINYFDDSTYQPERLMYWPSCPSDGDYEFRVFDGAYLNPDAYLGRVSDWRDFSLLPVSTREKEPPKPARGGGKQQDPDTKDGIVGMWCCAYNIEAVIAKYLPDTYHKSHVRGRYDYVPADSTAGLVIYNQGKLAYSFHAKDPAAGHSRNAFDLVRVHKFQGQSEAASFKSMCELAAKDEAVIELLNAEREQQIEVDFADGKWDAKLKYNRQGKLEPSIPNLLLIMRGDPALQNIRLNRLANQIYASGLPWDRDEHPSWRDDDTSQLETYLAVKYATFTAHAIDTVLAKVAADRAYHPIRDYLDALPEWDQNPRVNSLFIDYLGAEDTEYVRAVTRKVLVAAVARIRQPGIKFDSIPVLNGGQGIGKSTLIGKLGREWYSDSLSLADMKDKAAAEKLQGKWVLELSEMAGIKKMDVETVKSFASRTDDQYRPSYGRVVESHPRQTIIIGTTNNDGGFLRDVTGNRRFWPIRVTGHTPKRPWDLTEAEVDQIWAEALVLHAAGEELFLTGEVAAAALLEQRDALEPDDRTGLVANYLETLLPPNWDSMDTGKRVDFLRDPNGLTQPLGTIRREQVCNMEIWCECFENHRDDIRKSDSYEIEAMIKAIGGWKRLDSNKTGRLHIPIYGYQQIYVRTRQPGE